MAGGNLMQWAQQLDELEQVVKNFADTMRLHPRQDEWIAGDPSQALRETMPGDYLRDLPRLNTAGEPELHRTYLVCFAPTKPRNIAPLPKLEINWPRYAILTPDPAVDGSASEALREVAPSPAAAHRCDNLRA